MTTERDGSVGDFFLSKLFLSSVFLTSLLATYTASLSVLMPPMSVPLVQVVSARLNRYCPNPIVDDWASSGR